MSDAVSKPGLDDLQSTASSADKRPVRRRTTRLLLWSRRVGLAVKIEIALAFLALVSGIATYVALSAKSAPFATTSSTVRVLLLVNLVLLSTLAVLVARRLVAIWYARRQGQAGSRLQVRAVVFFSLVAIGPPIIMAIFSAVFLENGVQAWFGEKVRTTLNNSLQVAESYIEEHRRTIEADVLAMALDLNREAPRLPQSPGLLQQLVEEQTAIRALSEAVVFDRLGNVRAKATFGLDLSGDRVPDSLLQLIQSDDPIIISNTEDRVRAIVRLDGFFDTYLYVSRFVDAQVLGYVEAAQRAVAEYQDFEGQSSQILVRFNVIYIVVALLILLTAAWIGLWFANRLATPISGLVDAAERVRQGDLSARVPVTRSNDEVGVLSRAFNRMTNQLSAQRQELVDTNRELDERRRFLEAVLGGVSAGVIGLTRAGTVHLPNRSACELLGKQPEELVGQMLSAVVPEMAGLLAEMSVAPDHTAQGQVTLMRGEETRTLLVRIAAEQKSDAITGYVVTFDDVTDQLTDQRKAAWADVARRIAHEIKNPLTPIQLSAERLKRKYAREISSAPEVFAQCTDTIIRQVGDLRRMVDEFSSFARMPAPVLRIEDITDITRQAVFLQDVATPDIAISLTTPDHRAQLICDGRLIAQALANLLKNAAESVGARLERDGAGGQRGRIDVTVRADDETTELIVEDNGLGLPADGKHRLTEPYVTTRAKGTGLGLAIVKRVMEEHGGRLVLKNRDDGGASVTLRFSHRALLKKSLEATDVDQQPEGEAAETAKTAAADGDGAGADRPADRDLSVVDHGA